MVTVFGYVYKITNLVNGKIYFGITTSSIIKRWKDHIYSIDCSNKKTRLILAFRKHGKDNFTVELVKTCYSDEQLCQSEIFFIKKYKTTERLIGYNNSEGGELQAKGFKHNKETKKLLSDLKYANPTFGGRKNKGKVRTEDNRRRISETLKARTDNKGEFHNMAKLNNYKVVEIREKYATGDYTSRSLGKEYGISKTNILDILHKRIWKNI